MQKEQSQIFTWDNQGLFSNNYLETKFPALEIWQNRDDELKERFQCLKEIYAEAKTANIFDSKDEQKTENTFIRPVLEKVLGFSYDPQLRAGGKRPDYGLFLTSEDYHSATKDQKYGSHYYSHLIASAEAKYWGRPLNISDFADKDRADPTAQTINYLDLVAHQSDYKVLWAILTNGETWRLFYYRAKSKTSDFYQVNVAEICRIDDFEQFKYFYGMFSVAALTPDPKTLQCWLDIYLTGSKNYAEEVSEKLREVIFGSVFENLAEGIVVHRREKGFLEETSESKTLIFRATMTLLYRVLFALYAESRDLLPVTDSHGYFPYSLRHLCNNIWQAVHENRSLPELTDSYYQHLKRLFIIIDKGEKSLNVPRYNGGLFAFCTPNDSSDSETNIDGAKFLSENIIGDKYIAIAIQGLVFDETGNGDKKFYDYSSLDVQHLGNIYEGLLEFNVEIAKESMVAVPGKGKSVVWKPERFATKNELKNVEARKNIGDVYIVNSKGERKISGAYYTPQKMVEYIVDKTVVPKVQDSLSKAESFWKKGGTGSKNPMTFAEKLFSLTVCDPAMGSGHFLVNSVDVIADEINRWHGKNSDSPFAAFLDKMRVDILDAVEKQGVSINPEKLENRHLIRRMVLKRCIFGVDLNPMAIELAKLSLWLHSFTVGAPLSFLDHHLKCGNSLIGTWNIEEVVPPGSENWKNIVQAMNFMWAIDRLNDATIEEITESKNKYNKCRKKLEEVINRANIAIGQYFIPELKNEQIAGQVSECSHKKSKKPENILEIYKETLKLAKEINFFHWKLEFPDVFVEEKKFKSESGFDCVIGNPPWERMKLQETEFFVERLPEIAAASTSSKRKKLIKQLPETNPELFSEYKKSAEKVQLCMNYIKKSGLFPLLGHGDLNLYSVMMERALDLTKPDGTTGFLTPSGIATDSNSQQFFRKIVEEKRIDTFIDFENKKVFFPEVHASFKFAISIIKGSKLQVDKADFAFFIHSMTELDDCNRHILLTGEDFALFNPNTRTCPIFRSLKDAELTKKIYSKVPILIRYPAPEKYEKIQAKDVSETYSCNDSCGKLIHEPMKPYNVAVNPWRIRFRTLFHMSNDSHLFKTAKELEEVEMFWRQNPHLYKKAEKSYVPLYEAKMIHHFDHRFASCFQGEKRIIGTQVSVHTSVTDKQKTNFLSQPRFWVPGNKVDLRLDSYVDQSWQIGFRVISRATDVRSFISAIIPKCGAGNSIALMLSTNKNKHLLYANLSSFVLDFVYGNFSDCEKV